jgi:hypothetical protein
MQRRHELLKVLMILYFLRVLRAFLVPSVFKNQPQ